MYQHKGEIPTALEIASHVISEKGWVIEEDNELFQEELFFTAGSKPINYDSMVFMTTNSIMEMNLRVELQGTNPLLKGELIRLLNLVNRYLTGTICFIIDEDEEDGTQNEILAYRSQLYLNPEIGTSIETVKYFMEAGVQIFDNCLMHIVTFLSMKPKAYIDDGVIIGVYLKYTPEEVLDDIMRGPIKGWA